jgi:hypothetical protein
MKTASTIEATNSLRAESRGRDGKIKGKRGKHPNSVKNLKPFVPGVSGNPGGLPGYDVAAALARAVIEGSLEAAYQGFAEQMAKGNAYAFKEMADRGYGPLKQKVELSGLESVADILTKARNRAK